MRNAFGVAGVVHQPANRYSMRYAWPSGYWGSLPLEGGIEAAYRADIDAADDPVAKLKEIEDRDKTEAQKTHEALEKAQRELADVTLAKTRAEVAASKGVPAALLVGQTQTELEASADALLEYKGQPRMVVPNEGRTPILSGSTADAFAAFAEKHLS